MEAKRRTMLATVKNQQKKEVMPDPTADGYMRTIRALWVQLNPKEGPDNRADEMWFGGNKAEELEHYAGNVLGELSGLPEIPVEKKRLDMLLTLLNKVLVLLMREYRKGHLYDL